MNTRPQRILLLSALMLLAFALRWVDISTESLWVDEIYSYRQAIKPIANIIANSQADVHPPVYYILLHCWAMLFGTSEAGLRGFSLFCGVLAVPLMYLLGKRVWNPRIGMIAAFLLAISHFHIHYSQETRSYSYLVLVSIGGMLGFMRLWDEIRENIRTGNTTLISRQTALLFVFAHILLLYSHFFALFLVVAENVFVASLWFFRKDVFLRFWKRWFILQVVLLLIFTPWLNVLYWQIQAVQQGFWIDRPTVFVLGETLVEYCGSLLASLVMMPLLVLAFVEIRSQNSRNAEGKATMLYRIQSSEPLHIWFLWLCVTLTILIPFVKSLKGTPIYYVKYTIPALPAFLLLVAKGVDAWEWRRWYGKIATGGVLLALAAIAAYNTRNDWNALEKERWRDAAVYLAGLHSSEHSSGNSSGNTAKELVFVHDWYCWYNLAYYGASTTTELHALPPERLRITSETWQRLYASRIAGREQIYLVLSHRTGKTQAILDGIERDFTRLSDTVFPSRYRKYVVSDSFPQQTRAIFLMKTYLSNDIRVIRYKRKI
ncbi:MAG: hypothetical protein EAZ92_15325 [Candidatus Kapaibacterium sp.]|nr:MAG: hypothetical protein EAZ92_15325 [Candidatus Kapabacteria bacterium]